jgi:hypothetical protein
VAETVVVWVVSPLLQRFLELALEVRIVVPPAQIVLFPVMVGVGGAVIVLTVTALETALVQFPTIALTV